MLGATSLDNFGIPPIANQHLFSGPFSNKEAKRTTLGDTHNKRGRAQKKDSLTLKFQGYGRETVDQFSGGFH